MNTDDDMTHDNAAELLPWLANDSLTESEKDRVLAHAQSCIICRRDLAELDALRDSISAGATELDPPPVDMRRINRRIDEYMERRRRIPRALEALGEFLSSPWKAAVVLQSAVIVGLLIALAAQQDDRPRYTTLTRDTPLPPGHYLRLVVSTTPESGGLEALLGDLGLRIVDGPSPRGVATVAFPEATSRDAQREVIRALSENPMLRYVQPLTVDAP